MKHLIAFHQATRKTWRGGQFNGSSLTLNRAHAQASEADGKIPLHQHTPTDE